MKFILQITIDLFVCVLITLLFWEFFNCTSGRLFPHTILFYEKTEDLCLMSLLIFGVVGIMYAVLCLCNKRSVGSWIAKNKLVGRHLIRMFFANTIDISFVWVCSYLLWQFVSNKYYVDFYNLFFLLLFVYTLAISVVGGSSLGRISLGILFNHDKVAAFKQEILKFLICIVIPYVLSLMLGIVEPIAIAWNVLFFSFVLFVVSEVIFGRMLWDVQPLKIYAKPHKIINLIVLLILLIMLLAVKIVNNKKQPDLAKFLGVHFPIYFNKYPDDEKVAVYTKFMNIQNQSPKEYILDLFERYDVVILEESFHGECTEWDLIADIVTDSFFVEKVGNVFTEYGSAIHQNKIDAYLSTEYANAEDLEKATASLMYYMSGGFYNYIKSVNIKNSNLPDSMKLHHFYCDNIDWDYFPLQLRDTIDDGNRDKFMADVVVDWYKEQVKNGNRHKCLVVTNTRHSFGYAGGVEKIKRGRSFMHQTQGNQAMYIFEVLPGKVANVIQNTPKMQNSHFLISLYRPINYGVWDKAFEKNNYIPVGFDLINTPFGNDIFDAYSLRGAKSNFVYSDIYTGVIFNKPFEKMREFYHPYHRYAIEQEAKQKGLTDLHESVFFYDKIDDNESYEDNMNWSCRWVSMANAVPVYISVILILFSLVIEVSLLAIREKK